MELSYFYITIITLLALLAVGFLCRKVGIINDGVSKGLSVVTLKIGQPCMIVGAMINVEYTADKIKNGFMVLAIALLVHALMAVVAHFSVFKCKNADERKIYEFSMIFANCGFLGFPIIESFLGSDGLFYAGFYIIAFNLFMWTWGIVILARGRDDIKISVKTMLINYGTVPSVIGILLFVLHLPLPAFIPNTVSYLGSLCTPLSMLVTGSLIATCSLKEFFKDTKLYFSSLVKLILIPTVVCTLTYLVGFDRFYIFFFTVMSALPTATATTMYAEMYDLAKKKASVVTGMSSILSMATLPVLLTVLNAIFY